MKSRYDVSDLPFLIFIDMLDALEASASKEFDTTVSPRCEDDAAAAQQVRARAVFVAAGPWTSEKLLGAEIWRRDE